MAVAVAAVPFVALCLLPLFLHDPVAFNNRGIVWTQSLQWWRDNEWFGLGSNWYGVVGQTSSRISASAFSGHNQFIQFLVMGGISWCCSWRCRCSFLLGGLPRLGAARNHGDGGLLGGAGGTCFLEKPYLVIDSNGMLFGVVVLPLAVIAFCATPEDGARPVQTSSGNVSRNLTGARPHGSLGSAGADLCCGRDHRALGRPVAPSRTRPPRSQHREANARGSRSASVPQSCWPGGADHIVVCKEAMTRIDYPGLLDDTEPLVLGCRAYLESRVPPRPAPQPPGGAIGDAQAARRRSEQPSRTRSLLDNGVSVEVADIESVKGEAQGPGRSPARPFVSPSR